MRFGSTTTQLSAVASLVLLLTPFQLTSSSPPFADALSLAGGEFQFTLTAEANVSYVIQSSADLQSWISVATNAAQTISRSIAVPALGDVGFYRFTRQPLPLFGLAIAAQDRIRLGGSTVVDSFDSTDPLSSTNGLYDPSRAKDNGDVATNSRLTNAMTLMGTSLVFGRVATGPGGIVSALGGPAAGSKAWILGGGVGVQPGYLTTNMNVYFPDALAPFTSAPTPPSGSFGGTNYTYVLGNGDHQLAELTLSNDQKVVVVGDATLLVDGDVSLAGQAFVYISPGSSLKIIVGGASATFGGASVINTSGLAVNFAYYGRPGNTNIILAQPASIFGAFYAPEASLSVVSPSVSISGALVVKSITIINATQIHYDEALREIGPTR